MVADFMNDTEYVEICGSRTVLDVVSTLISIFDRNPRPPEAKTVGRISNPAAIKKEISCLQSFLEESSQLFDYFRKTALYLQERESAVQKHMKRLKEEEKEQERLRAKYAHGTIPSELMNKMLSFIPTINELRWAGWPTVYVDGLLPVTVYSPSLLFPRYARCFCAKWTLANIAKEGLKTSVLEDVALTKHITLRASTRDSISRGISHLRPLMKFPHQWKEISIEDDSAEDDFDEDDLIDIDAFEPCFRRLEELTAILVLDAFSRPSNTEVLRFITSLTVRYILKEDFPSHDAFKKALNNLPLVLSRLCRLRELIVPDLDYDCTDTEGLQRVHSTSLHSLRVGGSCSDTAIAFLKLFADCPVDHIDVHAGALEEAERLFSGARRVGFQYYAPDILLKRKQDGSLAFPKMEHMEMHTFPHTDEIQNHLLDSLRIRYEDPTVCRVGHLRLPEENVRKKQFQDELERYVPSLVLLSRF